LRHIAEITRQKNKPVRICGEIASNPFFATLLLGIGFTELSMNAYSIPIIRKLINGLTLTSVQELAEKAMNWRTASEVGDYLIKSVTELVKIDLSPYVREIQHS
jgi:phosphoenolpyruvate-protein kinase (PTS system EI component)